MERRGATAGSAQGRRANGQASLGVCGELREKESKRLRARRIASGCSFKSARAALFEFQFRRLADSTISDDCPCRASSAFSSPHCGYASRTLREARRLQSTRRSISALPLAICDSRSRTQSRRTHGLPVLKIGDNGAGALSRFRHRASRPTRWRWLSSARSAVSCSCFSARRGLRVCSSSHAVFCRTFGLRAARCDARARAEYCRPPGARRRLPCARWAVAACREIEVGGFGDRDPGSAVEMPSDSAPGEAKAMASAWFWLQR